MNTTQIKNTAKTTVLTDKEIKFVENYITTGNATQSVIDAGYLTKQPGRYAADLLRKGKIHGELTQRLQEREGAKIAKSAEILQFYTSVMRGEVLDQFGIEASLDTRIKSANELAKQVIEIPMKLEQKNITNNIGSITLNFMPRNEEIVDSEE